MDATALRDSWEIVAKSGDEVPLFFYSHLFLSHPELRQLFPIAMSTQRDRFVGALGRIVGNAQRLDQDLPFVEQLGRDHRRFGVVAEHYHAVGASLLATLAHFLGTAWTPELARDWATAYGTVAKVMVQAAETAAETSPATWLAEVAAVERRTLDITVLQIRTQEPYDYRPGQSFAMEVPQRPRLWRYYSPANAPRPDATIELHVQVVDGGQVSTAVARGMRVGDTVRLGSPVGHQLTLPDGPCPDLVMVAGGTGLAPLRAVLEQIDRQFGSNGSAPKVHLFHGARVPWNLYEHRLLNHLRQRPWFDYTEAVSDDPTFPGACGPVGTIAARHGSWQGRTAMVCGSAQMVEHTVGQLTNAGMDAADIRAEDFAGASSDDRYSQAGYPSAEVDMSGGQQ